MRYIYFTKSLQTLDIPGVIAFLKDTGLDGADLTVRPGYPVTPDNVTAELPRAAKAFADDGLVIGLVSTPTDLIDPDSAAAGRIFEACSKAGVPAVKIGYFPYRGKFDAELAASRQQMAGFAKLAAKTGVGPCYHTHPGNMLGNKPPGLPLQLQEHDAHHIGAFVDTCHT